MCRARDVRKMDFDDEDARLSESVLYVLETLGDPETSKSVVPAPRQRPIEYG